MRRITLPYPLALLALAFCLIAPGRAPADPSSTSTAPAPQAMSAPAAPMTGRAAAPNSDDHILAPGDLIEVDVFQEPDLTSNLRVANDGSVVFPLIDRVNVGGLTPAAAGKIIQRLLNKDYLVNPQVSLRVIEYAQRSFTVLGEVQKPGSYDMPNRATVTLLDAIGMAGGYTRVANPSSVTVKRRVKDEEVIYRLNAKRMAATSGPTSSFEVQPSDIITVSESIF